jgi:hypothetical protein
VLHSRFVKSQKHGCKTLSILSSHSDVIKVSEAKVSPDQLELRQSLLTPDGASHNHPLGPALSSPPRWLERVGSPFSVVVLLES